MTGGSGSESWRKELAPPKEEGSTGVSSVSTAGFPKARMQPLDGVKSVESSLEAPGLELPLCPGLKAALGL